MPDRDEETLLFADESEWMDQDDEDDDSDQAADDAQLARIESSACDR